jgi:hypothetical protein
MNSHMVTSNSTGIEESYVGRPGSVLDLRLGFRGSPWRLGPAWAVLAGALAVNAPISDGSSLLRLGGAILLADAVWGALWIPPALRSDQVPVQSGRSHLPYATSVSPMSKSVAALSEGNPAAGGDAGWYGIAIGLVLAAIVSLLLGGSAVVLSILAILAAVGVRILKKRGLSHALMVALLSVGLPWALGVSLRQPTSDFGGWSRVEAPLAVGAAYTILAWAIVRAQLADAQLRTWPLWVAQTILVAILVLIGQPLAAAMFGCLALVPSLWLSKPTGCPRGVNEAISHGEPWWLAGMLVVGLVVRG